MLSLKLRPYHDWLHQLYFITILATIDGLVLLGRKVILKRGLNSSSWFSEHADIVYPAMQNSPMIGMPLSNRLEAALSTV
jgi:hypothetical protein